MPGRYYEGREASLADIFGAASVTVHDDHLVIDDRTVPVVGDVIVCLPDDRLPPRLAARTTSAGGGEFDRDVQFTFGEEWSAHGEILPEHTDEFAAYFDLVDLDGLKDARVADLGCGSGRWATFVAPRCRELVLVDFSDAIFVARRNLEQHANVVFILGDVLQLPFRRGAFDLAYCLGVLHHTPVNALDATRRLAGMATTSLVYLYYALDNRPVHFRALFRVVDAVRRVLTRVRGRRSRAIISWTIAAGVYLPLSRLGRLIGARFIPLADTYAGKSVKRMQQDAYDRFFTPIEQRFSRAEILSLSDTFDRVEVSPRLPYWHFLCTSTADAGDVRSTTPGVRPGP